MRSTHILATCGGRLHPQFQALATSPKPQPITVDPRLILGTGYWNRCAGWQLFTEDPVNPVVRWKETNHETAPGLVNADGLTYDYGPYAEIWLSQRARDGHWEAMYAHELGHALGFGHKGEDPRVSGGIMGSEELWNPTHDQTLLAQNGYRTESPPPLPPPTPPPIQVLDRRTSREARRAARQAQREQRRQERAARRGR